MEFKTKGQTKPSFWKYLAMVVTCVVVSFLRIIGGTQFRFVVLRKLCAPIIIIIIIIFFVIIEIKDPPS